MLETQAVNITLGNGIDTKTNDKLVVHTKLTELENGIFAEKQTIKKRPGYRALSQNIFGSTSTIGASQAVFSFNDELLLYSNPTIYSYNETYDNWINKGTAYSFNLTSNQVVRNAFQQSQVDNALNGNIYISAWKDTRAGIRYTVKDFNTKLDIVTDTQLTATGVNPKLVSVGGLIFIFYSEVGVLKCQSWDVSSSTTWSSALTVGSDLDSTNNWYDVAKSGENLVVVYRTTTPTIAVKYIKQNLTIGSTTNGLVNPITLANTATSTIAVNVNQDTKEISIFWHNSVSGMQYRVLNFDFTDKLTTTVFDAALTATASKRITIQETSSGSYKLFYEVDAAATYNRFIKTNTATNTGSVGTAAVFKRSVGLASKVFTVNSQSYMLCVHDSVLQGTYFLLTTGGDITNKFSYGVAGGILENNFLPSAGLVGTRAFLATQVKTKLISDNGNNFYLKGVQYSEIDFDPSNNFYREKLGDNLHISGGYLSMYDGQSVVEHGFHLYPENSSAAPSTSGGSIADGTYLYYITYEWLDAKGQVHRSSPSVALTATVSGGGGSGSVTLTIPTLRLTSKVSPRTNVHIGVYRTKAGQTVAFRISSLSSFTFNDTSVDTVSYVDTQNDSAIGANDLLYTTGGVLRNGQSQPCTLIKKHKNRLFLAGLENPLVFAFSKEQVPTEGVGFPDEFTIKIDDEGGSITAIESMDDYFIIFKQERIYVLTGSGPNDLAQQNDYVQPTRLPSDVGCLYPNSVVSSEAGIYFQSNKGIYLLNRQLQVVYVGADVEAYNSQEIVSTDVVPKNNIIIFLTSSGRTLSYDYFLGQWSTYTNHLGVDATVWKSAYTYLRTDGTVYRQDQNYYLDGLVNYSLKIVTAWIKMTGVQNFQRVQTASVIGDYYSSHILQMSVAYDYNNFYFNSYTFDPDSFLASNTYGQDTTYGSGPVYGSVSDSVYQFDAHLKLQKCQAIKFKFEDVFSGTAGQAYSLSDLSLIVGVKSGLNKLKAAKRN